MYLVCLEESWEGMSGGFPGYLMTCSSTIPLAVFKTKCKAERFVRLLSREYNIYSDVVTVDLNKAVKLGEMDMSVAAKKINGWYKKRKTAEKL